MDQVSKRDEEFRQYALTAPPMRTLLTVCAPLALYQALQSIFKILDALMAAHISSSAVSAVSCLSQITLMITALGAGLAVGGSIKISEAYGRGEYDLVRRRTATLYAMAIAASLLAAGALIPFAEHAGGADCRGGGIFPCGDFVPGGEFFQHRIHRH